MKTHPQEVCKLNERSNTYVISKKLIVSLFKCLEIKTKIQLIRK